MIEVFCVFPNPLQQIIIIIPDKIQNKSYLINIIIIYLYHLIQYLIRLSFIPN